MSGRRLVDPDALRVLAAEGLTRVDAARRLGFCWDSVARAARRHGIAFADGTRTPARRAQRAELSRALWADPAQAAAMEAGRVKAVKAAARAKRMRRRRPVGGDIVDQRLVEKTARQRLAEADRRFGAALAVAYGGRP